VSMVNDAPVRAYHTSSPETAHTVRTLLAHLTSQLHASVALAAEHENEHEHEPEHEHEQNQASAHQRNHAPNALSREAREILATVLNISPGDVSRRGNEFVNRDTAARALRIVTRRSTGEPLAYALGSAAFRYLDLFVDSRVLIPRPETEIVVEQALRVTADSPGGLAVDIGTGSGAIALSLATEGRFARVIATDLSPDALSVARLNADRTLHSGFGQAADHTTPARTAAPIEFRQGADFEPLQGIKAQVIVSNPPYIAWEEAGELPASVRDWEPHLALFANDLGMARYDVLLAGASSHLVPGGWLVLEVDSRRADETARRATANGRYTHVELVRDLTGRHRVLLARVSGDIY